MKSFVTANRILKSFSLLLACLLTAFAVKAQTYTTIANGAWSNAATWQGGLIPDATNIPATAVVEIKHIITYNGANINNYGTITIKDQTGLAPRLIVASGITFTNNVGGKFYIKDGEYRQYRFAGGGETGIPQSGSFINAGGYVSVINSYVEIANNWENKNVGVRIVHNSSITTGISYIQNSNAIDSIRYTSVSVGWQGAGDISITGSFIYLQSVRFQIASTAGSYRMSGCIANGDIDYITQKNHLTNTFSTGTIEIKSSVITSGLNIDAYCTGAPALYLPNGKATGTQTPDCSLNYFPARLFASITPGSLNFSVSPVLVSGIDLNAGAVYKFEGIAPGIDAVVKIDSLIGGASIDKIDDNSGGLGYIEGFQPQVKSGPLVGESYAVFTMSYKITGTSVAYPLATFDITSLDIDGNSTMREFDQIIVTPGAVASYLTSTTDISFTQVAPGSFRGINIAEIERTGIDTASKANMFTVSSANLSSVVLKLGTVKTNTEQVGRQYGIYFKGFVYPNLTTLPVKLETFIATLNNNNDKVDLKWTTTTEENLSYFIVEKSTDGSNYHEIGLVIANGNSAEKINYNFTDNLTKSQSTILYYRIRSVDIDDKGKYSDTRIIRIGKQQVNTMAILTYPNPVTNELRITIPANWQNKQIVYEVYSANGNLAKKSLITISSQTELLNVSNLAPGFYIVRAICNGETAQQKIIKH